jgi:hypothetical protein
MSTAERTNFLTAASGVLSRFFLCTETTVPLEAFGLRVFASLNTAATPLSAIDNLKNEFFVRLPKGNHGTVSHEWRKMVSILAELSPKEFFRRRLLSYGIACKNDDKSLFAAYKSFEIDNKTDVELLQLLSKLSAEAENLRDIRQGNKFNATTTRTLEEIYGILTASIADILILACYRKLYSADPSEFQESTRLVRNYLFRELTIGQRDTSVIEAKLTSAAKRVIVDGLHGLKAELLNASDNDSFRRNFAEKVEERPRVQFYILAAIEEYLKKSQGLRPYPHSPRQHIEHIVPKKIDKTLPNGMPAWPFWRGRRRSLHERYLNRIGNLLILESDINMSVTNRSFIEKTTGNHQLKKRVQRKRGYCDSQFCLARKLSRKSLVEFTQDDIDKRQQAFARLALKVWALN